MRNKTTHKCLLKDLTCAMQNDLSERECRVRSGYSRWLWFADAPFFALYAVAAWCALTPLVVWAFSDYTARVVAAWLLAAPIALVVYVPFVALIVALITRAYPCERLPSGYLLYIFVVLQLAQTQVFYAVFAGNETTAYTNVCGSSTPPSCTVTGAPYLTYFAFLYYSMVTFVSVGYGDMSPTSVLARAVVLPELWAPVFFLGLLFGRIVASQGDGAAAVTAVQARYDETRGSEFRTLLLRNKKR